MNDNPTLNALRVRRHRARKPLGRAVLLVEINLYEHIELLRHHDCLKEWDEGDHKKIEEATSEMLALLAKEMHYPSDEDGGVS